MASAEEPREPREPPPNLVPMTVIEPEEASEVNSDNLVDIESSFRAWLVVVGAFLFLVSSFGMMQSVGTLQSYLHLNQLSNYSNSNVGWITGTYLFLGLLFSIQIGPLVDHYGPILLSCVGCGSTIAMFFLLAECKNYWQFMLCFGVFGGISSAIAGLVAVASVAKLFVRKRGLALGIAVTGSSVGLIIYPIMLRAIFPRLGWKWSMRIVAFFNAGMMVPGTLCFLPYTRLLRTISRGRPQPPRRDNAILSFDAFRSPAFSFVTAGLFCLEFVIFGIGGLLPAIGTHAGFTPEDGYTLIAIIGGTSAFGRVIPGIIGDRIGHFNVLVFMISITIVFMGTMFVPFGTSDGKVLYAFSALWGFCSGSFLSMTPVCMGKTCEAKDYGRYYGTMNFVLSFALLIAIPLSGIMLEHMGAQALTGLFIAIIALGGGCFFAARALLIGEWFSWKREI